jgi:hypothetical protein
MLGHGKILQQAAETGHIRQKRAFWKSSEFGYQEFNTVCDRGSYGESKQP